MMATPEELRKAQKKAMGGTVTEEVKETVKTPSYSNQDRINSMFDAMNAAQKNQIEQGYNQAKAEAQAARDKLPGVYRDKANDLAVQYERNRRNFNQAAASRGLNTGAGAQANLAMTSTYNRGFGRLSGQEAEALADADRSMAQLAEKAQSEIQRVEAENDYKKAGMILDDVNREYNKRLTAAQSLAQFGDFSGFAELYGPTQADSMEKAWIASHPDLAYRTGKIDANEYQNMTGKFPAGYTPPSSGGGGYPYPGSPNPGTPTDNSGMKAYAQDALAQGASPEQINSALQQQVNSGAISASEAAGAMITGAQAAEWYRQHGDERNLY